MASTSARWRQCALTVRHIGGARPSAAAMRPMSNYFDHLCNPSSQMLVSWLVGV